MKILSNSEYNKISDVFKDYDRKINRLSERLTKSETENLKLRNEIKSYKGREYKELKKLITKLYTTINMKLDYFDTSADEIDKLFEIYFSLKGTLKDD